MKPSWWSQVEPEANAAIESFTAKLRRKLAEPPEKLVTRKNPFLFRVRVNSDAYEFAQMITNAYLSSSEETMFGNVLEEIAISICKHSKGGWKSTADKIDLEYARDDTRYIMQIKSGTNWGNSSQRQSLVNSFQKAMKILRQGNPDLNVRCIEGICYGKSMIRDLGTHKRYVGHSFWKEISDWEGTAAAVMDLIGTHASNGLDKAREEAHQRIVSYLEDRGVTYTQAVDKTSSIGSTLAKTEHKIRWDRLLNLVLKGS